MFGELHATLAETVEAQLSVRYEDYGGSAGSSLDPKLALRWQILPSIGVRASVGTTFRGPTLNQIVASASSTHCSTWHRPGHSSALTPKVTPTWIRKRPRPSM